MTRWTPQTAAPWTHPAAVPATPCGCQCGPGLGFALRPEGSFADAFDWKTLALIAVAAIVAYRLFFSSSARARREQLGRARDRYRKEVARIRGKS